MSRRTMANLKKHASLMSSPGNILVSRFSRHPERYVEIFRILRKYELHHVAAEFGLSHRHEVDEDELAIHDDHDEDDDHAAGLASALEELEYALLSWVNCSVHDLICCHQIISRRSLGFRIQ